MADLIGYEHEWEQLLWTTLINLTYPEQVRVSGDWIVYVTQHLLPKLAEHRRLTTAMIVERDGWDAQRLAETIGSRTVAINRLAKEGRQLRAAIETDSAFGVRSPST